MRKTSVYVTAAQKRALETAAATSGLGKAELVRRGVEIVTRRHLGSEPTLPLFTSDLPDLAEQFDEELEGFGER